MEITQISPKFPPVLCGVGDYSRVLGDTLESEYSVKSRYLVAWPDWIKSSGDSAYAMPVHRLAERFDDQLDAAARETAGLIVQYSGYGFAIRGAPIWLASGINRLRRRHPDFPVQVMFHEVATRGTWRTSSFWNWPVQRWVATQLGRGASHGVFVNCEKHANLLRRWLSRPVQLLPVFSNLGEPAQLLDWNEREDTLAYFSWSMPEGTAASLCSRLPRLVKVLGVKRVVVLRHPLPPSCELDVPVETHPPLPPEEVSKILSKCRFAYSDSYRDYAGKSGLTATHAAHGLTTFLHGGQGPLSDGLEFGKHLFAADTTTQRPPASECASVAQRFHEWYLMHDRRHAAATYARQMGILEHRSGFRAASISDNPSLPC